VVDGLFGSVTHHTSVVMYSRHTDQGDGTCVWCGERWPCRPRLDAVAVIEAAGEDPAQHDRSEISDNAPTLPMERPPPRRWD
jgi:hypothetical protein